MGHSDIQKSHILLRVLPNGIKPYGVLMRLDRPVGWWLLLLPGWWGLSLGAFEAGVPLPYWAFALFLIGAVVMRGAGCIINDIWDEDLDKSVARTATRPIASGQIGRDKAIIFLSGLLLVGLIILLQFDILTIMLGCLSLPLVVAYPYMKRITYWPQAFLGLTFNFGALMGWAAMTGEISLPALLLYVSGIFWTLGYDTIYAHQDKEDDVLVGIKSTALVFGENSKLWVGGFYAVSFGLLLSVYLMVKSVDVLSLFFILCAAFHLYMQIYTWDLKQADSALRIFKSNRNYGLLIFAALVF